MSNITKSIFQIPYETKNKLLPQVQLSISRLLQYNLPPLDYANLRQGSGSAFLSSSDPEGVDDDAIARLQFLPVPSQKYIQELIALGYDAVEAGFQSITYHHLQSDMILDSERKYPLWVITYWEQVIAIQDVVRKWLQCRDWLIMQVRQKKSSERQQLAQKANIILTLLPWGQNKPHGLTDSLPIHSLWRYLGTSYLSCSEIEDALMLIRTDIISHLKPEISLTTQIEGTPFTIFLLEAYQNRDGYEKGDTLAWLRVAGESLVASDGSLATIANLEPINGQQHWVSLVITEGGKKVNYGDSLAQKIPPLLWDAVAWWICYHAPTLTPLLADLPTIPQVDGYSCGILAVTALRDAFTLPSQSASRDPATLRLALFNQVSNEIIKRLSDPSSTTCSENRPNSPSIPFSENRMPANDGIDNCTSTIEVLDLKPLSVSGPPQPAKRKLTDYWSVDTAEARQMRRRQEAERIGERMAENQELRRQKALEKQAERKKYLRKAQQECRQRKRESMIAKGWVPVREKRRKLDRSATATPDANLDSDTTTPPATLDASLDSLDNPSTFSHTSIAEISRPRRQFKVESRKNKKTNVGRKSTHTQEMAKRTNWLMPLIWSTIEQAAVRAGKPWSPRQIMNEAKSLNPDLFSHLREQVIGRWIDKEAMALGESRWRASVLEEVKKNSPGGTISRVGILAPYPAVQAHIGSQLQALRDAGVALTLVTIRALMIAVISDMAPEIYEAQAKDGSQFKCSETFVHKYLHKTLNWSEHRATKAAQKLPANYQDILREAFLREAFVIRDYSIPAALRVNTDQTQLVYQQGSDKTWTMSGVKQVSTIGHEEKRAFMLVPSISASGELLPMQAVYMGKTTVSCPTTGAPGYGRAQTLGFQMLPSMTSTYWSTQDTMQTLVDTIIAPYFERKKKELGLPPSQHSIWKIDCWSVHRSQSFREWMKTKHGNIIVIFVPGGCTSIWQPLDVGIQRVLKLSMRRSAHRDIVAEVSNQIKEGVERFTINTTLTTLRNRSLQWVLNAIDDIDNKELILKAFEMCRVEPDWNLSHASLTSASALEALRNLPHTNKKLYDELCGISSPTTSSESRSQHEAEELPFTECVEDQSDIPVPVLINALIGQSLESLDGFSMTADGSLERNSMAESGSMEGTGEDVPVQEGCPKRVRQAPVPFGGFDLWYEH